MTITGRGGEEDAQFGYTANFYTNATLTEWVTSTNRWHTGTCTNRTATFTSPEGLVIYGVSYNV